MMRFSFAPWRRLSEVAALSFITTSLACAGMTTGVKWHPRGDAPTLPSRGDGCYVEVYEAGKAPTRPYQVVGTLELSLDADQLASSGGQGVAERFKKAACEYGVFLVTDIKMFPDPTRGGASYEAKGAVYLDDEGRPILVRTAKDAEAADAGTAETLDSAASSEAPPAETDAP